MLEIKLFGSCEVRARHNAGVIRRLSVRQRHILQLLALYRSVSKADLAELLWEGNPPRSHAATLESHVFRLRRQLDPTSPSQGSVVVTRPGGYRLDDNRVEVDLWHFDRLLVQADGAPESDALALLAQAVALSSAPLLADDPSRAWAVAARQHHEARLTEAASQAAGYALRLGDPHRAAALAARATDVNPLAEDAWQIRLKAL
ncbi:MAG: hypothetical protein JWP76_1416, partial [Dactylosporangium sp.]|nr:hypothetical protein [Dactylosporangium sp.]